ncbi:HPr kinase/phosphorylase [Tabrizicola sp.]|uniref:HPr kinase/phosphorylase n=1 Tax=Tabrizicola sp. TaxID=2005166 RepID=UPI0026273B59|nr:HPr kinase/phosphatase C-terminal domain-containing protein [Tabrizicola sp.]MDM7931221.1 HPr kinase/phosphatase C-terminal domain-containing protein [Tabrizicola sp.]
MDTPGQILHGSCVAVEGRGLLILGPSGSGKSSLALRLIGLGAVLVADDRTDVSVAGGNLIARCPAPIRGLIEARGVGLLRSPVVDSAAITLVADLGQPEVQRLPPLRKITILGCEVDLVLHPQNGHFPQALLLYLQQGRQA